MDIDSIKQTMCDKYCKDCKKAKSKQGNNNLWYCGKHRRYVTDHSLATTDYEKECKDYEKR